MDIPKRIKKYKSVTIRLKQKTYESLCVLAKKNDANKTDVIEFLIEKAAEEESKRKKK